MQKEWTGATFDGTYADAKHQSERFNQYKRSEKRRYVAEKTELESLLGNIQTKVKTYGLRAYTPPGELQLSDLDVAWRTLGKAEAQHSKTINAKIGGYPTHPSALLILELKKTFGDHLRKRQTNSHYSSTQSPSPSPNSKAP